MAERGDAKDHLRFTHRPVKWPGKSFHPERGEYKEFSQIKNDLVEIKKAAEIKVKIFSDENLYFVVHFSEHISSPNVARLIKSYPHWKLTKIINDASAKFGLKKEFYENFLSFVEKYNKVFLNIRGVTLKDIFSEDLLKELNNVETNLFNLSFELSSSLNHKKDTIKKDIEKYLEETKSGKLRTFEQISYNIIGSLEIKRDNIQDFAYQLDGMNNIQIEQKTNLHDFCLQEIEKKAVRTVKARLHQMPSAKGDDIKVDDLPSVCILDSGISTSNVKLKKELIEATYDFESEKEMPCDDEDGHGTFVAGRVIHGNNVSENPPVCKVIMVKVFKNTKEVVKSSLPLLKMIEESVKRFKGKCKVYNLSFGKQGPDPIFQKRLDCLADENKILFVTSSGNFQTYEMQHYLNEGVGYPDYLALLNVYPPADCFNVLTVGSHSNKGSNICPERAPSPFSRCISLKNRTKPEILCEGGNLKAVYNDSKTDEIVGFNREGLSVWSYSSGGSESYTDNVGTSFAAPIAASIAARLFRKYNANSSNLIKALIINSCNILQDKTGQHFDSSIQGFGAPDEYYALNSTKSKATLFAESEFNLSETLGHQYKFHVADNTERIIITIVLLNPVEEHTPPGRLAVLLKREIKKAGSKSKVTPTFESNKIEDNTIHSIYDLKRGGKGTWSIKLKPRIIVPLNTEYLKYAIVITQIAKGSTNIYDEIEEWLKDRD